MCELQVILQEVILSEINNRSQNTHFGEEYLVLITS